MKVFFLLVIAVWSHSALAGSLFNDDVCPVVDSPVSQQMLLQSSALVAPGFSSTFGLSCKDLKTLQKADQYVSLILSSALTATAASPALGAELAAAGLSMANPAVATVVVVGGVGVTTLKLVLLATLDQCEQQNQDDLRQSLMDELETKYGLRPVGSGVQLEINH